MSQNSLWSSHHTHRHGPGNINVWQWSHLILYQNHISQLTKGGGVLIKCLHPHRRPGCEGWLESRRFLYPVSSILLVEQWLFPQAPRSCSTWNQTMVLPGVSRLRQVMARPGLPFNRETTMRIHPKVWPSYIHVIHRPETKMVRQLIIEVCK